MVLEIGVHYFNNEMIDTTSAKAEMIAEPMDKNNVMR